MIIETSIEINKDLTITLKKKDSDETTICIYDGLSSVAISEADALDIFRHIGAFLKCLDSFINFSGQTDLTDLK